jgi:hypothetical protein
VSRRETSGFFGLSRVLGEHQLAVGEVQMPGKVGKEALSELRFWGIAVLRLKSKVEVKVKTI